MENFSLWLRLKEGGMVADARAEEGKSKPVRRPSTAGAKVHLDNSGVAGGPGKAATGGAGPAMPQQS